MFCWCVPPASCCHPAELCEELSHSSLQRTGLVMLSCGLLRAKLEWNVGHIPEKKRLRAQLNPSSACFAGAAHFIPLQFLILILTLWFSAGEEFTGVTADSSESEGINVTGNDSGNVVVSSEWHTSLHFTVKSVFSCAARPVFWHPNCLPFRAETQLCLTYFRQSSQSTPNAPMNASASLRITCRV